MFFSEEREDIVDRGIEKGEREMRDLRERLNREEPEQSPTHEPQVGAVGEHNSGQMSAEASDQTGTTPAAKPHTGREEDIRNRKVDPEAVRESFKESELDPIAEAEPEEGEKVA